MTQSLHSVVFQDSVNLFAHIDLFVCLSEKGLNLTDISYTGD